MFWDTITIQNLLISVGTEIIGASMVGCLKKVNFPRFKSIGEILGVEFEMVKKNGDLILASFTGKISRDGKGNFQQTHCIFHDITAHKQAEGELKRIEWMLSKKPISNVEAQTENHDQGYGDLTELNRDGIILKSIGHERLKNFANDYLELLGTSSAIYEVNGDYAFGIFASGWCRMMDSASRKLCNSLDNVEALNSGRWLCHESCWVDCSKEAIAKRTQVDIACTGGIRLYAVPIFAGGNVIGTINFGYGDPPKDPEKLKMLADIYHLNHDDLIREARAYDSRPPYIIEMAKKCLNSTATLIGSMVETKQAMEALRESENQISSIFRSAPVGIGSVVNRVLIKVNNRLCEMTGYDETDLIGHSSRILYPSDEDFDFVGRVKYAHIADHGTGIVETRWQKQDGTIMDILLSSTPVDMQNQSKGVTFTALDITERKQAEKELKLAHERILAILDSIDSTVYVANMDTCEILFMNKRMITDFGGDKTGAICYSAFRKNSKPCECCTNDQLVDKHGNPAGVRIWNDKNPVTGRYHINYDLKEIQTAATRSADITKQLLAFARKQTISPRQLDLNNTVESMLNMLHRLIGEDIDLIWQAADQMWPVKMDPSQIDQILANLCVNARDAISGVGKLTIETGTKTFDEESIRQNPDVIPGDFVLLAVTDDGCGMDKDTLDNLFEPFFTTKEVGKGKKPFSMAELAEKLREVLNTASDKAQG